VTENVTTLLPFPMNAGLTMVAVELHGVLSHDRDCRASLAGAANAPARGVFAEPSLVPWPACEGGQALWFKPAPALPTGSGEQPPHAWLHKLLTAGSLARVGPREERSAGLLVTQSVDRM
jgi:hypothetical protein